MKDPAPPQVALGHETGNNLRQLTPLLVWAVVFCDIGTSVYYVPGILYQDGKIGNLAPLFVFAAMLGFLLLAAKYVEICWRNPDGGGVVSIASQAFTPLVGCIGGLLISVDYFLTSAISSVSGIHYLGSIYPSLDGHTVALASATLLLLAIVNTIGIRESAMLSLVMAACALVVDLVVIVAALLRFDHLKWEAIRENFALVKTVTPHAFLVGFAGAWLAFSGLESISQLSPAMRLPIKKTAAKGMRYVVITMVATAPLLTLFAIALLPQSIKDDPTANDRFISELGWAFGGTWVRYAVVVTASSLLLFAANTAIIGGYHVFLALTERGFMPSIIGRRNRYFDTPQIAILVATVVPMFVIAFTHGDLDALGQLYAFGLLGCFVLSSAGLDVMRWRAGVRGWTFWIGLATTAIVLVAFATNLYVKVAATIFGSVFVFVGLLLALGTRRKWFAEWFYRIGFVRTRMPSRIQETETKLEGTELEILSLTQAESLAQLYPSGTIIAMRSHNPGLVSEAISREKGHGGRTLYALYVEERTGLFVRTANWTPKPEGVEALQASVRAAENEGMTMIPIWTISYDAVEGILRAAETLGVTAIMIGVSQRSSIYHMLRGHVLAGLSRRLPPGVQLLICS